MLTKKNFSIKLLILQGLFILLITVSCNSSSNRNTFSDDKATISDESQSKIKELILKNFQFPVTLNNDATSGLFYVSVKIEKGGKISDIRIIKSEDSLKIPLLNSCQIMLVPSDSINTTKNFDYITKKMYAFEEEAMRVTKMIEPLNLPEWQNKNVEFAISFNIR